MTIANNNKMKYKSKPKPTTTTTTKPQIPKTKEEAKHEPPYFAKFQPKSKKSNKKK